MNHGKTTILMLLVIASVFCQDSNDNTDPNDNTNTGDSTPSDTACSNHPLRKAWNPYKVEDGDWLETPINATADNVGFCKGLKGKVCCKPTGFEKLHNHLKAQIKEHSDARIARIKEFKRAKVLWRD